MIMSKDKKLDTLHKIVDWWTVEVIAISLGMTLFASWRC